MIVDTPNNCINGIANLLADGVISVGRYLTTSVGSSKLVTPAEARALAAAGIKLFVVFEVYGGADNVNDINAKDGAIDAQFALEYLPKIGAPADGSVVVYFACDTDFSEAQIQDMVLPYFDAIVTEFSGAGYRIGVYGSGAVCQAVCGGDFADCAWLSGSTGWTDSKEYLARKPLELVLVQQRMETKIAGLDADTDEALGDYGAFLPFASAASSTVGA